MCTSRNIRNMKSKFPRKFLEIVLFKIISSIYLWITLEAAKEDEGSIGSKGSRTLHVENIRQSFFRRK